MASSKVISDLATLEVSIMSTTKLIDTFYLALRSPVAAHPPIKNPPQPLALLSDSCKVLKAQTTKLSLLVLNKPFSPTAITYILTECSRGCLPALMSALELCEAEKYTNLLHNHIKSTLSKIMVEMRNLMACIPRDEYGVHAQSRDTLASAGVIWAECDKMVGLASDGLVKLTIQKAEEYHSLLRDAIAELEEWDPDEDDSDVCSDMDPVMSLEQRSDPPVATTISCLESSFQHLEVSSMSEQRNHILSTLRTVRVLYPALQKRRLSIAPNISCTTKSDYLPTLSVIQSLDAIMHSTQLFTEVADEVAGALYEGDIGEVSSRLEFLHKEAADCASRARKNWKNEEDEFSAWVDKWIARFRENAQNRKTGHDGEG